MNSNIKIFLTAMVLTVSASADVQPECEELNSFQQEKIEIANGLRTLSATAPAKYKTSINDWATVADSDAAMLNEAFIDCQDGVPSTLSVSSLDTFDRLSIEKSKLAYYTGQ
jgi:hypothetical protein